MVNEIWWHQLLKVWPNGLKLSLHWHTRTNGNCDGFQGPQHFFKDSKGTLFPFAEDCQGFLGSKRVRDIFIVSVLLNVLPLSTRTIWTQLLSFPQAGWTYSELHKEIHTCNWLSVVLKMKSREISISGVELTWNAPWSPFFKLFFFL